MIKFESRFPELTFYVGQEAKQFRNGVYQTEDEEVISVLEKLSDVKQAVEVKSEPKQAPTKPKSNPKK